jgi:hypothetical protein
MNRDFADSESWPWAAVAKSKPQAEIAIKQGARGLVFGIKSATYRAGSLPVQPIFMKKSEIFYQRGGRAIDLNRPREKVGR